jgi:hypothetical protein
MEPVENSKNTQQSLNACREKSPIVEGPNLDPVPSQCGDTGEPSLRRMDQPIEDVLKDVSTDKTGYGARGDCDPTMTGNIINDPCEGYNRNTIYRYSKALRGADEAMMDLFRDIVVIDEDAKAHNVPIIWATQEKAVAAILQENFRKDDTLVVDRIRLPMVAIHSQDVQYDMERYTYSQARYLARNLQGHPGLTISENHERDTVFGITRGIPVDISYTLYAWSLYLEDMNQITEQIFLKFNPIAYINVRGVHWEIIVKLDSTANNIEVEPGDQAIRVIKFQFNMTAKSYIPQPIRRSKAVLKIKQEIVNGLSDEETNEVISRLEVATKAKE